MKYKEALNTHCRMAVGILLTMQLRDDCLESECYEGNYHAVQGCGANHWLRVNVARKIAVCPLEDMIALRPIADTWIFAMWHMLCGFRKIPFVELLRTGCIMSQTL